jgi:DNA helicase-2/ATP-dependent DNA helicase PcrA
MREKIRSYGVVKWRTKVSQLMAALPFTTDLKLRDWLDAANKVLPSYIPGLALQVKRDRKPNVYSALTVADVFGTQQRVNARGYTLGTVHSVKGETFLAVLFIAKHQAANGQAYHTILNSGIADNEELRTVYVAMTRPRRILVLAVPRSDVAVWQARFGMS